ncbi:hypothetical protein M0P48_02350 [Candidatus Gracilibacteria bacterium]|jgi:hypothetical protein|nr:hypothetical protein [Candidatus Gracilibacteria bacterium]
MKYQISITTVGLGCYNHIAKLPTNSTASDLQKYLELNDFCSLYRNGKKLLLTSRLKNNDIICMTTPIRGAVDIKCRGKRWRIPKSDIDDKKVSNFHAHNYDNNEILDLYTGYIYKNNQQHKITKKEWLQILYEISQSKEQNLSSKAKDILKKNSHARS